MSIFFLGPGSAGAFFLSSWFTMIFWGNVAPHVDIRTISYPLAMLITIGLWLAVAPLIMSMRRPRGRWRYHRE